MKLLRLFLLGLCVTLWSCNTDDDAADDEIVFVQANVDTAALSGLVGNDASAVANFGQPSSVANADFITLVRPGEKLIFSGTSSSASSDQITVLRIDYVSGDNFLENSVLVQTDDPTLEPGSILYSVNTGALEGDEMKYNFVFQVSSSDPSIDGNIYFVDPKIRMGL